MSKDHKAFSALFGVKPSKIRETCVITPFFSKSVLSGFDIKAFRKGLIYGVGDNGSFNLITTGIGAPFVGDAVLYLEDTPCKNVVFFGSCGAVREKRHLKIGSLTAVKKVLSGDSFIDILLKRKPKGPFYPDKGLLGGFLSSGENSSIKEAVCLTVGSLKLEKEYVSSLKEGSIDVLDMETAAFYAAAKHIRKKAVAALYVSDILNRAPYYEIIRPKNKPFFRSITENASNAVCGIVKKTLAE
ncbi:hypothetical protein ACFL42_00640 [Candidatus Omnitrophota bacterium]